MAVCVRKEQKEGRKERKRGRDKEGMKAGAEEKKKWAAVATVIYRRPQTKIPLFTFVGQALLKLKRRKKKTSFRVFALFSAARLFVSSHFFGQNARHIEKSCIAKRGHVFFLFFFEGR